MKLQRQHFLLSYLKTLSVGPVGVSNSQPLASQPGEQPSEHLVAGTTFDNVYHVLAYTGVPRSDGDASPRRVA